MKRELPMIKLYHGTNQSSALSITNDGIDLSKSKRFLDFGPGFYMTDNIRKAEKWAKRKSEVLNRRYMLSETPYIVTINIDDAMFNSLKCKKFETRNNEWAYFIIANRIGSVEIASQLNLLNHNLDSKYDVVIGEIADGSISDKAFKIRENINEFNSFSLNDLLPDNGMYYGKQFSLHTNFALSCIISIKCDILI